MTYVITALDISLAKANFGAYEPQLVYEWQNEAKTTQASLSLIEGIHTITWPGTRDWQEWIVDLTVIGSPYSLHPHFGPVHAGFMDGVLSVFDDITAYLSGLNWPPFYNTGHSKGAGQCLLFAAMLKDLHHSPLLTRAFEAPRVGLLPLHDWLLDTDLQCTQTFNSWGADLVTVVPPSWNDARTPVRLPVPDSYDIAAKHRIPAVIEALCANLGVAL